MDQRSGLACPCCAHSEKKLVDLLRHIRLLHFGTPGFTSLKCNLDGCQRTFRKFTVFRNHIYQIHSDSQLLQLAPETDTRTPSPSPFVHDDDPPHFYPELDGLSSESDEDDTSSSPSGYDIDRGILSMQKAAAIWILKTQEVCKLPQSTTAKIMEDVGSLYESALVNIHAHVSSLLKESGISAETIPDLSAIFSPDGIHGSLFRGLETHARQLQYYKSHLQFVEPQQIILGTHMKPKGRGAKRRLVEVKETMVYVPILQTLQVLLHNHVIRREIKDGHKDEPGYLSDFCDGEGFSQNHLFSRHHDAIQRL